MSGREEEAMIFNIFRDRHLLRGRFVHNEGNASSDGDGKPDFIGEYYGVVLGVEVTELYTPERIRGRTLKEHEVEKQRIVDRACERAVQFGLPLLSVGVIFTGNPSENEEAALTAVLFEMVKTHCPKPGDTIDLCDEDGLPDSLWRVFIGNWGDLLKEQCWEYIETGGVKTDLSAQLQRTIDQKGKKIANYRRFCERCWLIIAARGDRPSSFYEFDVDMTTTAYTSPFERVFFMHVVSKTIRELNVKPAN